MINSKEIPLVFSEVLTASLLNSLANDGFLVHTSVVSSGNFGNACVVLANMALRIRVVLDRSEYRVEVATNSKPNDWWLLEDIMASLHEVGDLVESTSKDGSVEQLVSSFMTRWREIGAMLAEGDSGSRLARLKMRCSERVKQMFRSP